MFALLLIAFIVVPIVELALIIWVGGEIGALNTIAVLLAISIGGAWLVKREGLGVVRRFRAQLDLGKIPGKEMADGVLIVVAGALLLTPGFISDILGILLLLPPVRAAVRAVALKKVAVRTWRRT